METSQRGSTVAVVRCPCDENSDKNDTIIVVARSAAAIYRIDDHVWLVCSGLAGDSRLIAKHLRNECQNSRRKYGEAPTIEEVAQAAAELQHLLSRVEGTRPLGCTAIVFGVDPSPASSTLVGNSAIQRQGLARIFRTDPGGVLEECDYCAAGQGQGQVVQAISEHFVPNSNNKNGKPVTGDQSKKVKSITHAMEMKGHETVDILTIEPQLHRRGNMKATCFLRAKKQTLHKIDDASTLSNNEEDD
jgi:20S proteasome alpha/beta subunit